MAARPGFENQFTGKVAVVTGSTQGLGEATARLFAERGAEALVICGRAEDRGRHIAGELSAGTCPTTFVRADLADLDDCRRVIDAAEEAYGRLDTLVNCAACTERGTVADTTPELWDRMFAVNVRAPFFLLQRAVALMRGQKIEGTIVNVITVSSHGGAPYLVPYASSKGALVTLTRNTANALLPDRIRVNGLNIGWMNTPGEHAIQRRFHDAPDDWQPRAAARQPFGRLLEPTEVARAIAFLASTESGMMTGGVVDFDQTVIGTVPDEQRF